MNTTVRVVRIYIKEADHGRRTNLMQEVLNLLHDQLRVRGVTVFRGIAGFGSTGQVHAADILRLTVDLPLVIEFFDEPAVVDGVLELLDGLVPRGHIVAWDATCRAL
jgi:PII-like signaling protein